VRESGFTGARRQRQENAGREHGQHAGQSGGEDDPEESGQSGGKIARASTTFVKCASRMHRGSWKSARIPMAYAGILDLSKPREPSNHAQMAYVGAAQLDLERVTSPILIIRGRRVILDRELASLYGVSTSRLNEAVKRNLDRFPDDFMFQLAREEHESLMSHIATSKVGRGGHRKLPRAFTEHGAIQAANIFNSRLAVQMGVHVVRAILRLRELLVTNASLSEQLADLERKCQQHDKTIAAMLTAIRQLLHSPETKRRGIGVTADVK
jgi:ORF6N domain